MASHDHTMLSPAEQVLRIINIVNLIPGLAFLIATGVTRRGRYWDGREIWAFVGIAPLTLSAILGLLVLLFRPRPGSLRALITAADSLLAGFALGIDSWGWARGRRPGVIGGHAASTLLVVFFIHAFFVLREIWYMVNVGKLFSFSFSRNSCARCPHCLNEARAKKTAVKAVGAKETYHRVPGRDDGYDEEVDGTAVYSDARPSTDDESARLV